MEFCIDTKFSNRLEEYDPEIAEKFNDQLLDRFSKSSEYQGLPGNTRWTQPVLDYAANYLGLAVSELTAADLAEVLFELFPRKVSCDSSEAADIVAEQRAFWKWINREYNLLNAKSCLELLNDHAVQQLEDELDNPENFGMAKSFFTMGQQAGFDMSTQDGLNAFMLVYNEMLANAPPPPQRIPFPPFNSFYGDDIRTQSQENAKQKRRKKRKAQKASRKRNR